jgi:hypothetical protein
MSVKGGPNTVTSGLVLELDAGNIKSYPTTGTTWFDKSGNAYNGTLTNGPTFNSGSLGSIVFDGVDDSCRSILNSQLSNSFTFSAFTKPTTIPITPSTPPAGIVVSEVASYNNYWAFLGLYLGKWHWALYDGGVNPYITSSAVPTTSWAYITGVRDVVADTLYFYVNGVLDSTLNDTTTTVPVYSAFTVGGQVSQPFGQSRLYNGSVAITQIYNKALSANEVLQNYNATKGRFGL